MEPLKLILTILGFSLSTALHSQSSVGLLYGGTQYRGDLSEDEFGYFKNLRSAQGLIYHYKWNEKISFYTSFISTRMEAYDKELSDPALNNRNLHFRSPLKELSMGFEVSPISFFTSKKLRINPYVKFGVSMFHFNPMALYDGQWIDLQPLRTEGQGLPNSNLKPYSLFGVSYPLGLGIKAKLNNFLDMRIEVMPRQTKTDYLDDVSGNYYDLEELQRYSSPVAAQLSYRAESWDINETPPDVGGLKRGNPNLNDWYIIYQVSFSYVFEKPALPIDLGNEPPTEMPAIIPETK